MINHRISTVRTRQNPLRKLYQQAPDEALIIDRATTRESFGTSPFHGRVIPGSQDYGYVWPFGIHDAVGGFHDGPNPGDILCAALAACLDSTIRMIADRLGVSLNSLEVDVQTEVDVRGTLRLDSDVPVGFQSIRCAVDLQAEKGTSPDLIDRLIKAAEHSCIVLQTLQSGVPVETVLNGENTAAIENVHPTGLSRKPRESVAVGDRSLNNRA